MEVRIDGIKAGVGDPADEPPAVNASRGIENFFGFFKPVDIGCRLAPKCERIALPARIDLMVAARAGVHSSLPRSIHSIHRSVHGQRLQVYCLRCYFVPLYRRHPRANSNARQKAAICLRRAYSRGSIFWIGLEWEQTWPAPTTPISIAIQRTSSR